MTLGEILSSFAVGCNASGIFVIKCLRILVTHILFQFLKKPLIGNATLKCFKQNWKELLSDHINESPQSKLSTEEWQHCVKSVQIRSISWSVFSCILTRNNSIFGQFSYREILKNFSSSGNHCQRFLCCSMG